MWAQQRRSAFSDEARAFGLPEPKGVLMTGVPGCGKSLTAKALAGYLGVSLLRLDLGKVMGRYVGSSEENIRKAIKVAESVAPCVLWVDELEKSASGVQSSGSTDGGTTSRVISTLLTWMEEKTAPVFLAATTNNVTQLPPEMLRKGRFDELFYIDLPTPEERVDILSIHLRKRNRDPEQFDLEAVRKVTNGFSGAELESTVIEGLWAAFNDKEQNLTTDHLIAAAGKTTPLSKSMSEHIDAMRAWSKGRARPASSSIKVVKPKTRKREKPGKGNRFNSVLQ
jgi:SpoVK/Ycf46/Vps4 family AAA+-type ATPase